MEENHRTLVTTISKHRRIKVIERERTGISHRFAISNSLRSLVREMSCSFFHPPRDRYPLINAARCGKFMNRLARLGEGDSDLIPGGHEYPMKISDLGVTV